MGSSVGGGVCVGATNVAEGSAGITMPLISVEVAQLAQNRISTKISVEDCNHGIFTMNFPYYRRASDSAASCHFFRIAASM